MSHIKNYLDQVVEIANSLDCVEIERMANILADVRKRGGRLFFLGVGGSAANCSHAVNDFRKLCGNSSLKLFLGGNTPTQQEIRHSVDIQTPQKTLKTRQKHEAFS